MGARSDVAGMHEPSCDSGRSRNAPKRPPMIPSPHWRTSCQTDGAQDDLEICILPSPASSLVIQGRSPTLATTEGPDPL